MYNGNSSYSIWLITIGTGTSSNLYIIIQNEHFHQQRYQMFSLNSHWLNSLLAWIELESSSLDVISILFLLFLSHLYRFLYDFKHSPTTQATSEKHTQKRSKPKASKRSEKSTQHHLPPSQLSISLYREQVRKRRWRYYVVDNNWYNHHIQSNHLRLWHSFKIFDRCVARDQVDGPSEIACFHFSSRRLLLVQR